MWRYLAKGGVSVLLIWLLLRGRDLGALLQQMLAVDRGALILAGTVLWSLAVPSSLRWSRILDAMGHRLGFRLTFPLVLVGLFFNLTLPSSVGGDAVRMWKAHRAGLPGTTAIVSVMIDRLVALAALLLLVLVALPGLFQLTTDRTARAGVVILLALGFIGFAVAMVLDRVPYALRRFRIVRGIVQLSAELRRILLVPRRALPVVLLSLINQGGVVVVVAILARGMGLPVGWLPCLIIVPLAILATVVPISVAGWGVREGAFVTGFGLVGVSSDHALALSVLFGLLNTVVCLPGGLVWLAMGDRRRDVRMLEADSELLSEPPREAGR
jgi:uncharacterized protein (TIRG00374 family)